MSGLVDHRTAALAMFVVALLLCACGENSGQAERFSTDPSHSKPGGEAQAEKGKARDRDASGSGFAPKGEPDSALNHPAPGRSAENCPQGVSKRVCAQVAELHKQQSGNPPPQKTETGKCPAAMSRSVCKAVTRAYKEGFKNGPPLKPGQCPPTLSQAQCAELAKVYAKATK